MFRVSQFVKEIISPVPTRPRNKPAGPVVIWNILRRCNLRCKHCYTNSWDEEFPNELSTKEIIDTIDDLKQFSVPVIMFSGGEPLLHPDIFQITKIAKELGIYVGLSTNGTYISKSNIDEIKAINFNYIGISFDGLGETHDRVRRKKGAFQSALDGLRLCKEAGLKVGARFTLIRENFEDFGEILKFVDTEKVDKFYLSHLNYSGRGNLGNKQAAHHSMARAAMNRLFEEALRCQTSGIKREFVTGNSDADGVFFLDWVKRKFPEKETQIHQKLLQWGGNSAGINIANIDNLGDVHPESFWQSYTLGNVRTRKFSEIWSDTSDPILTKLRQRPRQISGRCGKCRHMDICNGNTRVRAIQTFNDEWAEDPGCYLSDDEIF